MMADLLFNAGVSMLLFAIATAKAPVNLPTRLGVGLILAGNSIWLWRALS